MNRLITKEIDILLISHKRYDCRNCPHKNDTEVCSCEQIAHKLNGLKELHFEAELQELKDLQDCDEEVAHSHADDILTDILIELGYTDIVEAYNLIKKWYA